jgi:hypothetical protein
MVCKRQKKATVVLRYPRFSFFHLEVKKKATSTKSAITTLKYASRSLYDLYSSTQPLAYVELGRRGVHHYRCAFFIVVTAEQYRVASCTLQLPSLGELPLPCGMQNAP